MGFCFEATHEALLTVKASQSVGFLSRRRGNFSVYVRVSRFVFCFSKFIFENEIERDQLSSVRFFFLYLCN